MSRKCLASFMLRTEDNQIELGSSLRPYAESSSMRFKQIFSASRVPFCAAVVCAPHPETSFDNQQLRQLGRQIEALEEQVKALQAGVRTGDAGEATPCPPER
jgi:hypothetical protein